MDGYCWNTLIRPTGLLSMERNVLQQAVLVYLPQFQITHRQTEQLAMADAASPVL